MRGRQTALPAEPPLALGERPELTSSRLSDSARRAHLKGVPFKAEGATRRGRGACARADWLAGPAAGPMGTRLVVRRAAGRCRGQSPGWLPWRRRLSACTAHFAGVGGCGSGAWARGLPAEGRFTRGRWRLPPHPRCQCGKPRPGSQQDEAGPCECPAGLLEALLAALRCPGWILVSGMGSRDRSRSTIDSACAECKAWR